MKNTEYIFDFTLPTQCSYVSSSNVKFFSTRYVTSPLLNSVHALKHLILILLMWNIPYKCKIPLLILES